MAADHKQAAIGQERLAGAEHVRLLVEEVDVARLRHPVAEGHHEGLGEAGETVRRIDAVVVSPGEDLIEPWRMALTMSSVTRRGAGRPGTCAVVMTTSAAEIFCFSTACCLAKNSALTSLA